MNTRGSGPAAGLPVDLSDYTLAEIRGLLFEIAGEIRKREQAQVAAARTRALEIAQGVGLGPDDLLAPTPPAARRRRTPRR